MNDILQHAMLLLAWTVLNCTIYSIQNRQAVKSVQARCESKGGS